MSEECELFGRVALLYEDGSVRGWNIFDRGVKVHGAKINGRRPIAARVILFKGRIDDYDPGPLVHHLSFLLSPAYEWSISIEVVSTTIHAITTGRYGWDNRDILEFQPTPPRRKNYGMQEEIPITEEKVT